MSKHAEGVFLGAYAAYASLEPRTRFTERDFLHALQTNPRLRGLELPFVQDIHEEEPHDFLQRLPQNWEYVWTLLPGTMQALQKSPHYGLASCDKAGQKAALDRCELARLRIVDWHQQAGRTLVRAVHLHSAPTRGGKGVDSDAGALRSALETLSARDWAGAKLILEHCDAYRSGQTPRKGFLELDDEIALARDLKLGISINWGRSVLEGRSIETAEQHILKAKQAGVLQGLFFSGTAVQDPLYGDWQDNHAPIRLDDSAEWQPQQGLLGLTEVKHALALVQDEAQVMLGLKVQPFPVSLTWHQRLACVEGQLAAMRELMREQAGAASLTLVKA